MSTSFCRASLPVLALFCAVACTRGGSQPATTQSDASAEKAADASLYVLDSHWTDQNNRDLTLSTLRGKSRIVAMAYTSCEQACPMLVQRLKRLQTQLPAAAQRRVGFVLVSLDPDSDTPERLQHYAAAHGLDDWLLLTSNQENTRELAVALGVSYGAKQTDGIIAHSSGLAVLDEQGVLVYQANGVDFSPTDVGAVILHTAPGS